MFNTTTIRVSIKTLWRWYSTLWVLAGPISKQFDDHIQHYCWQSLYLNRLMTIFNSASRAYCTWSKWSTDDSWPVWRCNYCERGLMQWTKSRLLLQAEETFCWLKNILHVCNTKSVFQEYNAKNKNTLSRHALHQTNKKGSTENQIRPMFTTIGPASDQRN